MQPGDVLLTSADISHAEKSLRYHPQTPIEIGLKNTVDWLQTQL
jgi:nucleoside-diphosphate-sugar epimerase